MFNFYNNLDKWITHILFAFVVIVLFGTLGMWLYIAFTNGGTIR